MRSMICYRKAAVERAMKVQEVILRAMAKKITWWQAAEIIGISDRSIGACYDCLKSYGNQTHHEKLDKTTVVEFLA